MDTLTRDFVHAARALRKSPTFAITAIFTIALGIGASATIFNVVNTVLAAYWLTRWMASMLVGVTATDPPTYAAIALLFVTVAALASWLPARRAARLNPVVALREE
jgi:putative ABC transport system permease protein